MATIDLGKIKLVWRGTYDGSTAYTVDDVVQHTDSGLTSSFICTTNSTGNAPSTGGSVHGSWAYLAKGGTAGTDVGSTLTTQGDILYRDGSGLQRLAKGTASQQLRMNSSANAPEWATISGGSHTKIAEFTSSGNPTDWALDNIFTATYDFYMIYITNYRHVDNNLQWYMRLRTGGASGSNDTSSSYRGMVYYTRRSSGAETNAGDGFWDNPSYRVCNFDISDDTNKPSFAKFYIQKPYNNDTMTSFIHEGLINHSDLTSVAYTNGACVFNANTSHTGISFSAQDSSNKIANGNKAFVYGISY